MIQKAAMDSFGENIKSICGKSLHFYAHNQQWNDLIFVYVLTI